MDTKYLIRPLDDRSKYPGLAKIDPRLPRPWFSMLIQGGPGNGKTTLALNLVLFYCSFFRTFIFVSPSARLDEKVGKVAKLLLSKRKEVVLVPKISKDTMDSIMSRIHEWPQPILMLVDDVSGNANVLSKDSALEQMCILRAHLKLCIILNVHTFKSTPKKIRRNSDTLVFFDAVRGDLDEVKEELSIDLAPLMAPLKKHEFLMLRAQGQGIWSHTINI